MERYTWSEYTDMVGAYCVAHHNGRAAQRLYQQYPNRRTPHHTTFTAVYQRLRETGSFSRGPGQGRRRTVRTLQFEEAVLQHVERDPSISTRAIARNMGTNQTNVRNVLHEQFLRPFHLERVHNLEPVDYAPRAQFSQWYLEQ